jgi:hypothetical protein
MVIEKPIDPLTTWLPQAVLTWLSVVGVLVLIAAVGWALLLLVRRDWSGWAHLGRLVSQLPADFLRLSPRRVLALARLAIKESLRSRILVALAVLGLVLLYAAWFQPEGHNPVRFYLNWLVPTASLLVIAVVVLLSVFSLPSDIKSRTIHTIVTKPVRASEIVLGRILGFTAVGTVLLAVVAAMVYVFVVRMSDHTHAVLADSLTDLELPPPGAKFDEQTLVATGRLTTSDNHHHTFTINAAGHGRTESADGHWHEVTKDVAPRFVAARVEPGDATRIHLRFSEPMDPLAAARPEVYKLSGGLAVGEAHVASDNRRVVVVASDRARVGETTVEVRADLPSRIGRVLVERGPLVVADREPPPDAVAYAVSPPLGRFRARQPIYGRLQFYGRTGEPRETGISVGSEWTYRRYIEGATQSAAAWTFDGVDASQLGDWLQVDLTLRVFRTTRGRIDETVRGTIALTHPNLPGRSTRPRTFHAKDGLIDSHYFARRLLGTDERGNAKELDLLADLVHDGRLRVVVQCLESGQYFGVAQADCYLLPREGSFAVNYLKTFATVWLQMVLLVTMGVTFSTVLSGPVALLAMAAAMIFGSNAQLVADIAADQVHGGGPLEAAYRISNQMNVVTPLEPGLLTTAIQRGDAAIRGVFWSLSHLAPDLTAYSRVEYLANGFAVPGEHLVMLGLTTLGFIVPIVLVGYWLLKTREIAA